MKVIAELEGLDYKLTPPPTCQGELTHQDASDPTAHLRTSTQNVAQDLIQADQGLPHTALRVPLARTYSEGN